MTTVKDAKCDLFNFSNNHLFFFSFLGHPLRYSKEMNGMQQFVIKRNGQKTAFKSEKITARLRKLCYKLSPELDIENIVRRVVEEIGTKDMATRDVDLIASRIAGTFNAHPDYQRLASRIKVARLHKEIPKDLNQVICALEKGDVGIDVSQETLASMKRHMSDLNSAIVHDWDYAIPLKQLEEYETKSLAKRQGVIIERPSHMLMRWAVEQHMRLDQPDTKKAEDIIDTYHNVCQEQIPV